MNAQERHDQQAPEVVQQNYPEAVQSHQYPYANNFHQQQQWPTGHQQQTLPKPEDGTSTYASGNTPYSVYSGSHADHASPHSPFATAVPAGQHQPPAENPRAGDRQKGLVCGFTPLVAALIAATAMLFVAVVGLAAGTGVESSRANAAEAQVRSLRSAAQTATVTVTATATKASPTSFAALDDNCSEDPDGVSGTTYSAFAEIQGDRSFTIQCNADAVGIPLLQLFTSDLNTCMDACAAWSHDLPASFAGNPNTTCGAVSFIPAWTNKTVALAGTAPGNCYLKPMQTTVPNTPNIGTPVHAGILIDQAG